MSGTVVAIGGGPAPRQLGEVNTALVETLEAVLEKARSGELQSVVGTGFTRGGCRLAFRGGYHENVYEMLGSLHWLCAEYVHQQTAEAPDGQHP